MMDFLLLLLIIGCLLGLYFLWLVFSLMRHAIACMKVWLDIHGAHKPGDYYYEKRDDRK